MHPPPPPDPRELLPPLLACLPTASVSLRPPPALLPLLSPLLRQRVTFLAAGSSSHGEGWLPLLSWDGGRGSRLPHVVERMHLEPHPISGEVELEDVPPPKYRRLDEETLQAKLDVAQFDLAPVFVWCASDEHGGTGPGWKLSDLQPLEDVGEADGWRESIAQVDSGRGLTANADATASRPAPASNRSEPDDDAYWNSYDRTPGRTPGKNRSPAPRQMSQFQPQAAQAPSSAEADYYARYGAEVQPAMDAHDPDEEHPELGESTLNGDALLRREQPGSRPNGASLYPSNGASARADSALEAPSPHTPDVASMHSSVEQLEERAAALSGPRGSVQLDRAQVAIKQHISTDIKSLFRLARAAGMERVEFEDFVRRELDVLSLLERDD